LFERKEDASIAIYSFTPSSILHSRSRKGYISDTIANLFGAGKMATSFCMLTLRHIGLVGKYARSILLGEESSSSLQGMSELYKFGMRDKIVRCRLNLACTGSMSVVIILLLYSCWSIIPE
jgi:hypothetical protein